jgi:hypothetical protein
MADSFEDQTWVKLGVAAALAKQYQADQRSLLTFLSDTLEKSFPGSFQKRTKGLFGGKHIVGLDITLSDFVFSIDDPGNGSLVATRKRMVRGIALKTDNISMSECLEQLGEVLEETAKRSGETHDALARSLGLGI